MPVDNSVLFEHYCNMNTAVVYVNTLISVATVREKLD